MVFDLRRHRPMYRIRYVGTAEQLEILTSNVPDDAVQYEESRTGDGNSAKQEEVWTTEWD